MPMLKKVQEPLLEAEKSGKKSMPQLELISKDPGRKMRRTATRVESLVPASMELTLKRRGCEHLEVAVSNLLSPALLYDYRIKYNTLHSSRATAQATYV